MKIARALVVLAILLIAQSAAAETVSVKLRNGIQIRATEVPFVPAEHHLSGCGQAYATYVVDGTPAIGAVHMPKTQLSDVTVIVGRRTWHLDTRGMFDPLLHGSSSRDFGAFCYDSDSCTIRAILGDAGGAHVAEWIIANGVQRRSVLTDSNDLINFMRQNLTPPHFE